MATQRAKKRFGSAVRQFATNLNGVVSTPKGDWVVKGFIDIAKNIYTISADTKVISKITELLLFPSISKFAQAN
ncbi:MAG: hypothetical protein HY653_00415, partial [Acidobacteria bacterium]|nr:hypothetical protein [Acidobacteriota bacterium]